MAAGSKMVEVKGLSIRNGFCCKFQSPWRPTSLASCAPSLHSLAKPLSSHRHLHFVKRIMHRRPQSAYRFDNGLDHFRFGFLVIPVEMLHNFFLYYVKLSAVVTTASYDIKSHSLIKFV